MSFAGANSSGGHVYFVHAKFSGSEVSFDGVRFFGGTMSFTGASGQVPSGLRTAVITASAPVVLPDTWLPVHP